MINDVEVPAQCGNAGRGREMLLYYYTFMTSMLLRFACVSLVAFVLLNVGERGVYRVAHSIRLAR